MTQLERYLGNLDRLRRQYKDDPRIQLLITQAEGRVEKLDKELQQLLLGGISLHQLEDWIVRNNLHLELKESFYYKLLIIIGPEPEKHGYSNAAWLIKPGMSFRNAFSGLRTWDQIHSFFAENRDRIFLKKFIADKTNHKKLSRQILLSKNEELVRYYLRSESKTIGTVTL